MNNVVFLESPATICEELLLIVGEGRSFGMLLVKSALKCQIRKFLHRCGIYSTKITSKPSMSINFHVENGIDMNN